MDRPEHLQVEESPLGFAVFPAQRDQADEDQVSVRESLNAQGPHLWVSGEEYRGSATAVELTAESAWRFAEQIMTTVANHYQGDARPPVEDRVADIKPMEIVDLRDDLTAMLRKARDEEWNYDRIAHAAHAFYTRIEAESANLREV